MHGWEIGFAGLTAFIAVMALVRLMNGRRDALIRELNAQVVAVNAAQEKSPEHAKGEKPKP